MIDDIKELCLKYRCLLASFFLFIFINSCACNWLWCSFILFLARYHLQYLNTSFKIFQAIDNKYIYNLHRGLLQFIAIDISYSLFRLIPSTYGKRKI